MIHKVLFAVMALAVSAVAQDLKAPAAGFGQQKKEKTVKEQKMKEKNTKISKSKSGSIKSSKAKYCSSKAS